MIISLRISDEDAALFRKYAELNGVSLSEMIRQSVISRIEKEYDMETYREALSQHKETDETLTLEETERRLNGKN